VTALELLRRCITPKGFVAALDERANYRRVWSRDGCIASLAALASGDAELVACAARTLITLRDHQGPSGQLPSNVGLDGEVSFGGSAGRVDATLWWSLTVCLYGRVSGDDAVVADSWPALTRAVEVLRAWEHNDAGLVYVPQAGDWADEYLLSGYLLYDQCLRLWMIDELDRAAQRIGRRIAHQRGQLRELIAARFAPDDDGGFFCAGFHAGARFDVFDAFGNALACLLDVGSEAQRAAALHHTKRLSRFDLVPAFWPPITGDDPRMAELEHAAAGRLRNTPGRYHNGGLWPMLTGFWCLAAERLGDDEQASRWRDGIARANAAGEGYPEYLDAFSGEPGGVHGLAWSAAAQVVASAPSALWR
jgi:hypothetical protein